MQLVDASSSAIHSRTPLVARPDANRGALGDASVTTRKSLALHDDENFLPLEAPATPRTTVADDVHDYASPMFAASVKCHASPLSSLRIRRHAPYAPLVVHPALLCYPPLPESYMLDEYTALDTALAGEPLIAQPELCGGELDLHSIVDDQGRHACLAALLNTSAPSTIHDISTSTAGDNLREPTTRRRPGIAQDEFYRKYGPPPRVAARDRGDADAANTSLVSTTSSEPSERPRPEGRRCMISTPADARCGAKIVGRRARGKGPARHDGGVLARVQFAVRTRNFFMSKDIALACPIGAMVIVDGDRGLDAGMLVEACPLTQSETPPTDRVHRPATRDEIAIFHSQREAAEDALVKLRYVLAHPTPAILEHCTHEELSSITLLACEFQLDGGKLTVVYTASTRVRYAAIAAEAFRVFRCRIWMHQLNYVRTASS